jgi:hypothetical protein
MTTISYWDGPSWEVNWQQGDALGLFTTPQTEWQQALIDNSGWNPGQCRVAAQQSYEEAVREHFKAIGAVVCGFLGTSVLHFIGASSAQMVGEAGLAVAKVVEPVIFAPLVEIITIVAICVICYKTFVFIINLWTKIALPGAINCWNHGNEIKQHARTLEIRGAAEVVT